MSEVQELTPITDRVKYERGDVLCRVEVDCRAAYQPLPGGFLAQNGKQTLKVRKQDLALLLAMVEPAPAEIEAARRRFETSLTKFVNDGLEGVVEPTARQKRKEQLEAEFPGSVEAIFHRDNDRSILPLNSVRVLEDGIPVPADESQLDQQSMMAKVVASEVAKALAGVISQKPVDQQVIDAAVAKALAAQQQKKS